MLRLLGSFESFLLTLAFDFSGLSMVVYHRQPFSFFFFLLYAVREVRFMNGRLRIAVTELSLSKEKTTRIQATMYAE